MSSQTLPIPRRRVHVGRLAFALLASAFFILVLVALVRWGVFYSLYTWLFHHVVELTGQDVWISRAIALALLTLIWFLGWHLLVLPWIGDARKRAVIILAVSTVALGAMELVTRGVYFSRADGRPLKYYIRTLDGYEFSDAPGTHPVFGVSYKPITTEVAKEYWLWKKRGGKLKDPSVPDGYYFDPGTGEPLRWYAELPNKTVEMFTLPGFHPRTGQKLLPATPEIVARYERQKAREEETRLQKEKARKEAERRRQAAAQRQRKPVSVGRYVFPDPRPSERFLDFRFTLDEVRVTADSFYVQLSAEHLPPRPPWRRPLGYESRRDETPEFRLITARGRELRPLGFRVIDGALVVRERMLMLPDAGRFGRFEQRYPPLRGPDTTFTLTLNGEAVFGSVDIQTAEFRAF